MNSSTTGLPPGVAADHRARLEAFVLRARRLWGHPLAADRKQLARWATGPAQIASGQGSVPASLTLDLPPEAEFESLAARCRPLTLQCENLHLDKVFGSVKAFIRDDPQLLSRWQTLRMDWRDTQKPARPILIGAAPHAPNTDQMAGIVEVAEAWLNGDLVHAGRGKLPQAQGLTLSLRYLAAVMFYARVAVHAVALLNLIRYLQDHGRLGLDPEVFARAVSADVPLVLPIDRMAVAPAAHPMST